MREAVCRPFLSGRSVSSLSTTASFACCRLGGGASTLVTINPGSETAGSVSDGNAVLYPDVILASTSRGRRTEIVVEVETAESVNNLEALAQWAPFARLKAEFHLYVPAGSVDSVRRLCQDHAIDVSEIWTFHAIGDQMRFTMVYRAPAPARPQRPAPAARSSRPSPSRRAPGSARTGKPAASRRPAKRATAKPRTRPRKPAAKPARSQRRK